MTHPTVGIPPASADFVEALSGTETSSGSLPPTPSTTSRGEEFARVSIIARDLAFVTGPHST